MTARPASRPKLDQRVLTLAWLARVLEGARGDLTLPQYRLLALLVEGEERASQIAGQLELAKPTVSATIDTLADRGLVERATVEGDRRAVRLTTTAAGRSALATAEASMRARLDELLAETADPARADAALDQLAGALEESRRKWITRPRGRAQRST
jgi:DNA-binding MarR family transcriptional regulator